EQPLGHGEALAETGIHILPAHRRDHIAVDLQGPAATLQPVGEIAQLPGDPRLPAGRVIRAFDYAKRAPTFRFIDLHVNLRAGLDLMIDRVFCSLDMRYCLDQHTGSPPSLQSTLVITSPLAPGGHHGQHLYPYHAGRGPGTL